MPLITNREFENTYASPDGSIFIDFDAIDKELNDDNAHEISVEEDEETKN